MQRNYRVARGPHARGGEVDLILRERDGTLVFVEVRARGDGRARRRRRERRRAASSAASCSRRSTILLRFAALPPCRFDVVAIDGDSVQWLRAAFDAV